MDSIYHFNHSETTEFEGCKKKEEIVYYQYPKISILLDVHRFFLSVAVANSRSW